MYGNLQITSLKAVLIHPQNNQVVVEWDLSTIGFKILPQIHPKDVNKVVAMITDSSSTTGYGTIIFFCEESEALIKRVHQVRRMFRCKSYGEQMKEDLVRASIPVESFSHYMVPRLPEVRLKMDDQFTLWRKIANISEIMLDSSVNYQRSCGTISEDDSLDSSQTSQTRESKEISMEVQKEANVTPPTVVS